MVGTEGAQPAAVDNANQTTLSSTAPEVAGKGYWREQLCGVQQTTFLLNVRLYSGLFALIELALICLFIVLKAPFIWVVASALALVVFVNVSGQFFCAPRGSFGRFGAAIHVLFMLPAVGLYFYGLFNSPVSYGLIIIVVGLVYLFPKVLMVCWMCPFLGLNWKGLEHNGDVTN